MAPGRRNLLLGAVAVAAAGGGIVGGLKLRRPSGMEALLAASFPDLSGRRRRLSEWQGRPLLCNFWATWCAPCREELPLLDTAFRENVPIGLQIVGIAIDNVVNVSKYLKSVPIGYTVLIAEGSGIGLMGVLGNTSGVLPFTITVDGAGR